MPQAKIDSISIAMTREKNINSIVEWFAQHKRSFYLLGWSYLRNEQQMEELFFQAIHRMSKEISRYKGNASFETQVTSVFMELCHELSSSRSSQVSEENEQYRDLFDALDQLEECEKDIILLSYVKGMSKEEAANLLQVPVGKLKEHLFSGIQSLRKAMGYGSHFSGCKEYYSNYIDYLEKNMDRSKKIDFEMHIYHCHDCQEDLATFQDVMLRLLNLTERLGEFFIPSDFMENVKARVLEKEKKRQLRIKKHTRRGFAMASIFLVLTGLGFFTGAFANLYYSWTEDNPELRPFLQHHLGKMLNLEAENDGVKITIKSAIADEVQTLVFYEIEDTTEDNQFMMMYEDGVSIENTGEIMIRNVYPRYYPPDFESDINKNERNVYQGKLSLPPINEESGTLKLKITKLLKLINMSSNSNNYWTYDNIEEKIGEWSFEIPVTKKPSTEYVLDEETEIEGIPVRMEKLTIAPTATIIQYAVNQEKAEKQIEYLDLDWLEVNNKKFQTDLYGNSYMGSNQDMNWTGYQTYFDPLFENNPKEVKIKFRKAQLRIEDLTTIMLDGTVNYPQTFEYAGSTISIEKVEVGEPTEVVISNHEIENRIYESLHFGIIDENENFANNTEMSSEGVLVDKYGKEYNSNETTFSYEEIEQPRFFETIKTVRLYNENSEEKIIPKRLEIYSYFTTKYLDDMVKISLD